MTRDLAELMGVSPATVNKIEQGTRTPSLLFIADYTRLLSIGADFLFSGRASLDTDPYLAIELDRVETRLAKAEGRRKFMFRR